MPWHLRGGADGAPIDDPGDIIDVFMLRGCIYALVLFADVPVFSLRNVFSLSCDTQLSAYEVPLGYGLLQLLYSTDVRSKSAVAYFIY